MISSLNQLQNLEVRTLYFEQDIQIMKVTTPQDEVCYVSKLKRDSYVRPADVIFGLKVGLLNAFTFVTSQQFLVSQENFAVDTGVEFSKYWVGKPKYWEGQKVVKSDKCMSDSQLLWGTCQGCPLSLRLWLWATTWFSNNLP